MPFFADAYAKFNDDGTVAGIVGRDKNQTVALVSGAGNGRTRIGMDGDSLFGQGAHQTTIASASQIGGVATFALGRAIPLSPGQRFRTAGFADIQWEGDFVVSTVASTMQITASISPSASATAVSDGDSGGMMFYLYGQSNERHPVAMAAALNGAELDVVNTAVGGRTSIQRLAEWNPELFRGCALVVLEACANDAKNGVTVAQSVEAMRLRVAAVRAVGSMPVITTTAPYGATYATTRVTNNAISQAMRDLAIELDCPVWDWNEILTDKLSANGQALAGVLDADDIHVTSEGWKLAAPAFWSILNSCTAPRRAQILASRLDAPGGASFQAIANAPMDGTNGTTAAQLSGGVAGGNVPVPTGWEVTRSAYTNWNLEKVAGRFGDSNACRISVQSAANNNDAYLRSGTFHTLLTPGKRVSIRCRLICNMLHAYRVLVGLDIRTATGGLSAGNVYALNAFATNSALPLGEYSLDISSLEDWVVPAGFSCSSARFELRVLGNGAAGGVSTITLDSPAVYIR